VSAFALHVPVIFRRPGEVGFQVLLPTLVEGGLLGSATAIGNRSASL
jgi:hypothetical protein